MIIGRRKRPSLFSKFGYGSLGYSPAGPLLTNGFKSNPLQAETVEKPARCSHRAARQSSACRRSMWSRPMAASSGGFGIPSARARCFFNAGIFALPPCPGEPPMAASRSRHSVPDTMTGSTAWSRARPISRRQARANWSSDRFPVRVTYPLGTLVPIPITPRSTRAARRRPKVRIATHPAMPTWRRWRPATVERQITASSMSRVSAMTATRC